jgi:hypothetical protein
MRMPKVIDKEMVIGMVKMGFKQAVIADRLGCSTRQIRRIFRGLGLKADKIKLDTDVEEIVRDLCLRFESGEKASLRFGVSRQAILK